MFQSAQCANCHRFGSLGSDNGPDLTTIAKRFQKREVLESIVHPSQVISDQYATKTVLTEDGGTYSGMVMPGGDDELNLLQSDGSILKLEKNNGKLIQLGMDIHLQLLHMRKFIRVVEDFIV